MRKFLSSFLYLFLGLPLALSTLFLISARPWALDRETYRRFVEDDRLYAALRSPRSRRAPPRRSGSAPPSSRGPSSSRRRRRIFLSPR